MFVEEWKGLQTSVGERGTTTFSVALYQARTPIWRLLHNNTRFKGVPYSTLMGQRTELSKTGDYNRYLTYRLHYQYKRGDLGRKRMPCA